MTKKKTRVDIDVGVEPAVVAELESVVDAHLSDGPVGTVEPTDRDLLLELVARMDAIDTRLDVLESGGASFSRDDDSTSISAQSPFGVDLKADSLNAYEQVLARRESLKRTSTLPPNKRVNGAEMRQKLKDLEEKPVATARMRLQDMKTKGVISDFRILAPGVPPPSTGNPNRVLVTIDSSGVVIGAEVG